MGVVYRATQFSLGRPVALKVIASMLADQVGFQDRFVRESRLAASLDHPNVIPVYAAGEEDGVLYIAMRYVEGTDLRALISLEGKLEPLRAAGVTAQVASALEAAHDHGLVHRDVKPANVVVAARGGGEHVYLTDFGLTKRSASDSGLTAAGEWVGTLDYVAPEQVRGERLDGRADIYALGCVLYEALTGRVPFPRDNDLGKLWAHVSDPAPSALEAAPDTPPQLAAVASRAMEKDPDDRFDTAGEMARAALAATPAGLDTGARAKYAAGRLPFRVADVADDAEGNGTRRTLRMPWSAPRQMPATAGRRRRAPPLAVGMALALLAGVVAVLLLVGGDSDEGSSAEQAADVTPAGRVVGPPIKVGDSPSGIAVGAGAVWVANTGDETVTRIDPGRGEPVGRPIRVGEDPSAIAAGHGAVWVANLGDGTVMRIDPKSNKAGPPIHVGGGPTDLVIGPESVWVATEADRLVRIDEGTSQVSGSAIHVKSDGAIALAGGRLWVADMDDGTVRSIDARTELIVDTPIPVGDTPVDLAVGRRFLWVSLGGEHLVKQVDLAAGPLSKEREAHIPGRPEYLARVDRALWITDAENESVSRIDALSGRMVGRPIRVGEDPGGIAAGGSAVWVTSAVDDSVSRIEPR